MTDAPLPHALPAYQPPKVRQPATLPPSMEKLSKPHGIINKVIGRMLKLPKLSPLKMMSMKKVPRPFSKPKKKKVV